MCIYTLACSGTFALILKSFVRKISGSKWLAESWWYSVSLLSYSLKRGFLFNFLFTGILTLLVSKTLSCPARYYFFLFLESRLCFCEYGFVVWNLQIPTLIVFGYCHWILLICRYAKAFWVSTGIKWQIFKWSFAYKSKTIAKVNFLYILLVAEQIWRLYIVSWAWDIFHNSH